MISLIIPTYLSEKNLPILLQRIFKVFEQLDQKYEIIFINDCSPDNTLKYLVSEVLVVKIGFGSNNYIGYT